MRLVPTSQEERRAYPLAHQIATLADNAVVAYPCGRTVLRESVVKREAGENPVLCPQL